MGRASSPKRRVIATILALTILTVMAIWVSPALAVPGAVTGLVSATHPDEATWYSSNSPSFAWDPALADSWAIAGYSCVLDQNASTIPDTVSDRNSLTYLPRVTYTVGSRPAEARIADLSGDGKPDLVVENYSSNTVSVLLGNGDGTLAPKVDYATAAGPWSMAIGDVNGDGKTDVVTGNYAASSASVLIANGNGTFQARVDYTTGTGTNPECLRMGDVNGDGKLDIFTANASTNNISVLLNNGNGTFGAPSTFGTPTHPTSIDLCDLNGDGKQDLSTANYSAGSVSVLFGNGNGTFQTAANYAVSGNPQMVLAADLNRDGKPDLATVNWGSNTASVLLNNGNGTYAAKVDYAIGNGPYAFSVIDLNQDSAPDLVTTNNTASSVSILYGNGDGTFDAKTDLATGSGPCFVALGDLNGDGYGDLITTDLNDGKVSVFRGTAFLGASFSGKADGVWYFHVRAVNAAGEGGPTTTRVLHIDATAPATSDSSAPALASDGDSAWRTTSQRVSLEAADSGGSGLADTYYTLDGVQHPYTDPFEVSGDGNHAITYWSTDAAGNAESAHTGWVNIDSGAPVSNDSSSPALALDAVSGWHNTAQLVTLSAADVGSGPVSGLAGIEYDLDDAGYVPYTAPFVVSGERSHTLLYRAVDRAGNVEVAHTAFVNIDATAPTVTSSADADASWHSSDVEVTLTTGDGSGSGVDKAQYRAGTSGAWTDVSGDSFMIPAAGGNGPVTYQYKAIDEAGNETTGSCTVNFDTTAPVTSDASTPDPLATSDGTAWRNTSQQVTINATDVDGAGVASIHYIIGPSGDEQTAAGATADFTVSGDGSHRVEYWAVDAAGNAETPRTGWVNIWATAPVTRASATDGTWQKSDPQTVTLTVTGGYGATTIHYQVDDDDQVDVDGADVDFAVTGDGSHQIVYWSTDSLGNAEAQQTGYVNIDTAAPLTADTYAGGSAWQTGPVSFSLTPTDSGSGMTGGSAGTTYQIDGGALQSGTDLMVAGDGEHTVTYSSSDNAGNVESVKTLTVRIDAAAPVTGDDAPTAWQNTDTNVTLTPTDLLSGMEGGLAGTTFELDGGATECGTSVHVAAPADHSSDGAHVIAYRSSDAVGNLEADKIATVLVDTLPPVTRDDIVAGPPAHTDPVTVTLSASDANGSRAVSGVATTHYRVDDGAWQMGSSVEVSGDGQHTLSYYSTDNAGNYETVMTSRTLTIGTTPPGASTDDAPAGWVDHAVILTITPGERAVSTTYELDGGPTQTGTSVVVEAPATHANDGEHVVTYRSTTIGDVSEATRTAVVRIDTTAPQTSDDAPAGWQHGPVTLTLGAGDAGSGVASTTYAIDGGAPQQGTSIVVIGDGTHSVTYFSSDNAGNVEAAKSATVRIDDSAPQVTCPQAGRWFKTKSVTARFTATDGGSGVHDIAYRLGQGPWKTGSSVLIKGLGRHVVSLRATDANGNVSATKSGVIGIDRGRPKFTRGLTSRGRRSGLITLRFRVQDPRPSCGGARVTKIVITNPRGKKVATITKLGKLVRTNATVKCRVTYKLKRGFYRFRVYVVDLAGNKQKKASPGKLVVK